jgi:ABC-type phosphate transport system substrate-binding protein
MKRTALVLLISLMVFSRSSTQSAGDDSFKIIINVSNPASSMTRSQVSMIFLKKAKTWSDGQEAAPVDQWDRSPVRSAFSRKIHNKPVGAVKAYWNKQIYTGRVLPPPVKKSDADVIAYVKSMSGAIGYVSARAPTADVKVLAVIEK